MGKQPDNTAQVQWMGEAYSIREWQGGRKMIPYKRRIQASRQCNTKVAKHKGRVLVVSPSTPTIKARSMVLPLGSREKAIATGASSMVPTSRESEESNVIRVKNMGSQLG